MAVVIPRTKINSGMIISQKLINYQIRRAKLEDFDAIGDLWLYNRCHHEQWDVLYKTTVSEKQSWEKKIRSSFGQNNQCILVAENTEGRIIGYIHGAFYPWPFSPFKVYGSLNTITINPEVQSQGLGKKLIQQLLEWFRVNNVQHISVHVDCRNQAALHLYKNLGFRSYQHRLMLDVANSP